MVLRHLLKKLLWQVIISTRWKVSEVDRLTGFKDVHFKISLPLPIETSDNGSRSSGQAFTLVIVISIEFVFQQQTLVNIQQPAEKLDGWNNDKPLSYTDEDIPHISFTGHFFRCRWKGKSAWYIGVYFSEGNLVVSSCSRRHAHSVT